MKPCSPQSPGAAGFTLIEMIGVLAILAITASILVPNALRSLDQAAILAEGQTLANVGNEVPLYLRDVGSVPAVATWNTQIATYANLSPLDLATNRRGVARVYVTDPASSPTPRVLILSSMRANLGLPAAAIITAADFQTIWQTSDGSVPAATSWAGWNAWSAVANGGNYLVIERVNLQPLYLTVTLNNLSAASANYSVGSGGQLPVGAGGHKTLSEPQGTVISLYNSGGTLDYSYVVGAPGKTFNLSTAVPDWTPQ
jgi:prepilin-type N-terminal cleavage/methylation domain-containing protein